MSEPREASGAVRAHVSLPARPATRLGGGKRNDQLIYLQ